MIDADKLLLMNHALRSLRLLQQAKGLKEPIRLLMNFRKIGMSYMIIRGRTRDNIYLQKEYVDAMYKMYNEKETKCLLEGEFISIDSGLVFPDYNPLLIS